MRHGHITSKKTDVEQYMCGGKHPYKLRSEAEAIARKLRRNHRGKVPVIAYKCPVCHAYHVGSNLKW